MSKKRLPSISDWFAAKRRNRKKEKELEKTYDGKLEFINASSGFICIPYEWSTQLCNYVSSFDRVLEAQLDQMEVDEFNGGFKDREIQLMCEYEQIGLQEKLLLHKFMNRQIESKLKSQIELMENEIQLIEESEKIMEKKEEDNYEEFKKDSKDDVGAAKKTAENRENAA